MASNCPIVRIRRYVPNPPATKGDINGTTVWVQALLAGGDYAFASLQDTTQHRTRGNIREAQPPMHATGNSNSRGTNDIHGNIRADDIDGSMTTQTYWMAIAYDAPSATSGATAAQALSAMRSEGLAALRQTHQQQWADLYPQSFISIAQNASTGANGTLSTALEGFYWNQMYKLHSAVRSGGVALDLMGPWFQPSGWLYYWFDLNVQLQYWPLYTANRLDLADTLNAYITRNTDNLYANGADFGPDVIGVWPFLLALGGKYFDIPPTFASSMEYV